MGGAMRMLPSRLHAGMLGDRVTGKRPPCKLRASDSYMVSPQYSAEMRAIASGLVAV